MCALGQVESTLAPSIHPLHSDVSAILSPHTYSPNRADIFAYLFIQFVEINVRIAKISHVLFQVRVVHWLCGAHCMYAQEDLWNKCRDYGHTICSLIARLISASGVSGREEEGERRVLATETIYTPIVADCKGVRRRRVCHLSRNRDIWGCGCPVCEGDRLLYEFGSRLEEEEEGTSIPPNYSSPDQPQTMHIRNTWLAGWTNKDSEV